MDLLVNDLSLHGQFADLAAFRASILRVIQIRNIARRYLRTLYCHRGLVNGQVNPQLSMSAAVRALPESERRALMSWLSKGGGPFWDDDRTHDCVDWYESGGEVVTDTAVGEAAHCLLHGIDRGLVSIRPSNYMGDPIAVEHVLDDDHRVSIDVPNFCDPAAVEAYLKALPQAVTSWAALEKCAIVRFENLTFALNAFESLGAHPFKPGVAERILVLLEVLHQLKQCFDENGVRTVEGHVLIQQYFTGEKGWFSDESNTNKDDFWNELTFPNPDIPNKNIFCSWHGKVKTPQYRIHFSWPVTAALPLYIVYIGPKITKS